MIVIIQGGSIAARADGGGGVCGVLGGNYGSVRDRRAKDSVRNFYL